MAYNETESKLYLITRNLWPDCAEPLNTLQSTKLEHKPSITQYCHQATIFRRHLDITRNTEASKWWVCNSCHTHLNKSSVPYGPNSAASEVSRIPQHYCNQSCPVVLASVIKTPSLTRFTNRNSLLSNKFDTVAIWILWDRTPAEGSTVTHVCNSQSPC